MTLISDKYQNEKLNKLNINIKTKFIVGDKILERNSNNTYNDNIDKGIIALKEYYLNNKLIVDKIKKERKGDKYIITIPFED